MNAVDFIEADKRTRAAMLSEAAVQQNAPTTLGELEMPYKLSRALLPVLDPYFRKQISDDDAIASGSVLQPDNLLTQLEDVLNEFRPRAIEKMKAERPTIEQVRELKKNLYQLAGARELAFANKATRSLSTSMGSIWEDLADISPFAINPERHFGIKLRGIDVIVRDIDSGRIEFGQLKTQRNTLTGSQNGRTNSELGLYENSFLAACFSTNAGWTFKPQQQIVRLVGEEFWSKIGMDYQLVVNAVSSMVRDLEDAYIAMLD